MARKSNKSNMVKVEILRPFHIGIDKPVHYKPGIVEVEKELAERLISKGLASKQSLKV